MRADATGRPFANPAIAIRRIIYTYNAVACGDVIFCHLQETPVSREDAVAIEMATFRRVYNGEQSPALLVDDRIPIPGPAGEHDDLSAARTLREIMAARRKAGRENLPALGIEAGNGCIGMSIQTT